MIALREQKIRLGQMREMGVRGLLIHCSDEPKFLTPRPMRIDPISGLQRFALRHQDNFASMPVLGVVSDLGEARCAR